MAKKVSKTQAAMSRRKSALDRHEKQLAGTSDAKKKERIQSVIDNTKKNMQ
jgi:hypothetical protein